MSGDGPAVFSQVKSAFADSATRYVVLTIEAAPALHGSRVSWTENPEHYFINGNSQHAQAHGKGNTDLLLLLHLKIPHKRPRQQGQHKILSTGVS